MKGLIILKRLNTREDINGINIKDTEYVFAAEKWTDIVNKLVKFPKKRLSWLIVAQVESDENNELQYTQGLSGIDFLKNAQKYLSQMPVMN